MSAAAERMYMNEELRAAGHAEDCGIFWTWPSTPRCTCGKTTQTLRPLTVAEATGLGPEHVWLDDRGWLWRPRRCDALAAPTCGKPAIGAYEEGGRGHDHAHCLEHAHPIYTTDLTPETAPVLLERWQSLQGALASVWEGPLIIHAKDGVFQPKAMTVAAWNAVVNPGHSA